MGGKGSKATHDPGARAASQAIDKSLHVMAKEDERVIKLLLLGAGESGKSTCFRQMLRLYSAEGFSVDELLYFAPVIRSNVVQAVSGLADVCHVLGEEDEALRLPAELEPHAASLKARADDSAPELDPDTVAAIKALWDAPAIQLAFERRAAFQIPDSAPYFIERVDELAAADYVPTEEHMIRCRVRTTGIVEKQFQVEKSVFNIVDVGGQRNERRKWIHCFDSVTAVIFVAAASEYDQVMFEDPTQNRLDEALELFTNTTGLDTFRNTSFILFLNKSDLFADKIAQVPLTRWDPNFDGDVLSFEETMRHVASRFYDANRGTTRPFLHVTCATDHTSVDTVFRAVKRILVAEHLKDSGLIV